MSKTSSIDRPTEKIVKTRQALPVDQAPARPERLHRTALLEQDDLPHERKREHQLKPRKHQQHQPDGAPQQAEHEEIAIEGSARGPRAISSVAVGGLA